MADSSKVLTQKAKSICALVGFPPNHFTVNALKHAKIWPHDALPEFPFFARPCPMQARHGFVESRLVNTQEEFNRVVEEVNAANEPEAEIIMMSFLPCQFSGILTTGGIAYGPGNDGVTGGQEARAIPAATETKALLYNHFGLDDAAKIAGVTGSPYLEFVETAGALEAVQLRNGPDVPLCSRYIPRQMTVVVIVVPTALEIKELLAWETRMKALKGATGVVVYWPGGAMTGHVAVQAIEQTKDTNAPFAVWLTQEPPQVGQVLEPTVEVDPITPAQHVEFAQMLAHAITMMDLEPGVARIQAIELAIAALHASPMWNGERHLLVLRAMAIASMMRFASAAILGELRYWRTRGPGGHGVKVRRTTALDEQEKLGELTREQVYERAFDIHMKHIAPRMGTAYRDFMTKGWGGSFGGKKWGACTKQTILLFNHVSAFLIQPNGDHWKEVMGSWNATVNVFHNTGKFLNKFISNHEMDVLAKVPVLGFTNSMVGYLVVNDEDFGLHRNPTKVGEEIKVIIPKLERAPKPVLPVLTTDYTKSVFEATWRVNGVALYLQVRLPHSVDKSYGTAFVCGLNPHWRAMFKKAKHDGASLAGSGTPCGTGTVRMVDGIWILEVTQNGMRLPIYQNGMIQALISAKPPVEEADDVDVEF